MPRLSVRFSTSKFKSTWGGRTSESKTPLPNWWKVTPDANSVPVGESFRTMAAQLDAHTKDWWEHVRR